MEKRSWEVGIIGAGPYGLAAAAHLRAAGVETCIFGQPMEFWSQQMPRGMCLRSPVCASHISDPDGKLGLDRFAEETKSSLTAPIPLQYFVDYGRWFQQKVAPDLDKRRVLRIDPANSGFDLVCEDGEKVRVKRVVVATGIGRFARRVPQFASLPRELASHAIDQRDFRPFAGTRVVIVGGGQSALESAALLHEVGAEVEVIARAPHLNWLGQRFKWLKSPANPLKGLLYHPTDVGPPGLNWLNAMPDVFKLLPRETRERFAYRSIRPAGAPWLVPRLQNVKITTGRAISCAAVLSDRLHLTLDDGTVRHADHLLQATGYAINIAQYGFLTRPLLEAIHQEDGYPQLSRGFESSVPGLHFIGATGAKSFGPLCRFVSGGGYAARSLTHNVIGTPRWKQNWT